MCLYSHSLFYFPNHTALCLHTAWHTNKLQTTNNYVPLFLKLYININDINALKHWNGKCMAAVTVLYI